MNEEFDHRALAKSITKMLATANTTVEKAGASIVTQRLIDYSSGEFGKLTQEQMIEVLKSINPKYEANLLKDGNGNIIGYSYSSKIFVSLKDNQQKAPPWQQPEAAADAERPSRGRRRGQQRRRNRHTPSNPEKITGESMNQQAGKKSAQGGGGQEDYAAKYAAQYMGKQEDTKTKKKSSKKMKDEGSSQGGQEDYAAKYAAQYMDQQGGDDKKSKKNKKDGKKSEKKADKKKSDKKAEKKSDKKKSDKKKK